MRRYTVQRRMLASAAAIALLGTGFLAVPASADTDTAPELGEVAEGMGAEGVDESIDDDATPGEEDTGGEAAGVGDGEGDDASSSYELPLNVEAVTEDSTSVTVDVLSINDFHGRIVADGQSAGAATLACVVDSYRAANPNTIFVSAGDNIGASTFVSAVAQDQPTLEVLNAMGLDVATFGNHEFDQGRSDVDDRVIPGSNFPWISANIYDRNTGERAYDPYYLHTVDGVTFGFIGAITEEMPALVSPDRIADLDWRDMGEEVNAVAAQLRDGDASNGEADVLVVIVHDGAATPDASSIAEGTPYGDLVHNIHPDVSAIISGHTHLPYVHEINGVTVMQSAQYGEMLGHLVFEYDTVTGEVSISAQNVDLVTEDGALCEPDADIQAIVDEAVANAKVLGNVPIGEITDDFLRAVQPDGSENRGGESTIGNWVADVYAWAAVQNGYDVDIAFMNPGGIRTNMLYAGVEGDDVNTDGVITYEEAAMVQPFANTITYKQYTGAQIKQILEEQWQPEGASRPFLKLGVSDWFTYTYDPTAPAGERITGMWLIGQPIEMDRLYGVATNSFLMAGGDNFATFAEGGLATDTGWVDLAATVEYFKAQTEPVSPDYAQRAIGITWVSDPDQVYNAGDEVVIETSSWTFTADADRTASEVAVLVDGVVIGFTELDITAVEASDEAGRATIRFAMPEGITSETGEVELVLLDLLGSYVYLPLNVPVEAVDPADPPVDPTDPGTDPTDPGTDPTDPGTTDPASPTPTDPSDPSMPDTGVNPAVFGILAGLLLAAGGAVVLFERRARAERREDATTL